MSPKKRTVLIITAVVVALLTYIPTIAEILVAKHISVFIFFLPVPVFPNLWVNKTISPVGYNTIVYLYAIPFALLKGILWSVVLYYVDKIVSRKYGKGSWRIGVVAITFMLLFFFLQVLGSIAMIFMMACAAGGM